MTSSMEPDHSEGGRGQGVGARVARKEDARHLHGKGRFVADIAMPDLQEVAFLRSPVAHARLLSVTKPARHEQAVIVREDMAAARDIVADSAFPSYQPSAQAPLASGKVRFVGEPVAMAFAPTRAEAEDIAEQVVAEFDELPALTDVAQARQLAGEVRVHEHWRDNTFLTLNIDKNFEARQREASVVVHRKVNLARQCMVPMEGKAVLAYWDHQFDQLVVYSATQVPHMIRTILSHCLGLDQARVRVISPDVGGAFGYKCVLQQEELCIAWLAMTFQRPFRFIEDRREHLTAGANSREHHYELTAYADKRGRLLALDAKIAIDGGAYSVWPFTIGLEPGQAIGNLPGPYAFDGYRCETTCVATNKPGFVPYRGVARTGVCFAMELVIDAIAREVGREPWEVRCENLVPPQAMPYVNVTNKHFDGGDYPASVRQAMEMIDLPAIRARQQAGPQGSRYVGVGFGTYTEQSAHGTSVFAAWGTPVIPGFDSATVRITPDGGLEVRVGVHSHGQGMETTFAQIAHEILGIDIGRIKLVHGDTGLTPFSTGTYASRSLVMSGGAVSRACKALLPRLRKIGAHMLGQPVEAVTFAAGAVRAGDANAIDIGRIADAWYINPHLLPPDVDAQGLEVTMGFKPAVDTGSFTYATHAVAVEVDIDSGHVEILDYVVVEDCGTMINPMVVEGQTYGGVAQGIGTAMFEEMRYDGNGQPLASTLADYMLPGPTEIPSIRIHHFETPSPHTEFGAKGMGEGGAIAPPAAIFNAVNDALRDFGVELQETPLTPRKILEALDAAVAGAQSKKAA
ncbi:xanthine dehydrogenase family protein [Cupriavidus necator]|uniref:Xanthine dehydrogenase family protein molybdopterin-binding subunit n=1 Tax=Cupriavidus necator TaxID=106590 RepID=A0A367PP94_CUPNE|nr:xanthine dehydrogenase family protein molybdopterin-binding subunit [Cupriavidus necator]QQX88079.1 xanthine dehydrogenase family protein [Cupriavidus necator]RCJ08856.1 xanthine dehydrogenase family protein molybdopterin-binding subunit [Cupriavidus necator]